MGATVSAYCCCTDTSGTISQDHSFKHHNRPSSLKVTKRGSRKSGRETAESITSRRIIGNDYNPIPVTNDEIQSFDKITEQAQQEENGTNPIESDAMKADIGDVNLEEKDLNAWEAEEKDLEKDWGDRVLFNVFRIDTTKEDLESAVIRLNPKSKNVEDKIAVETSEIKEESQVKGVKNLVRTQFLREAGIDIDSDEKISLFLDDTVMSDTSRFWEDHALLLPVFITVWIHKESLDDLHAWMSSKIESMEG